MKKVNFVLSAILAGAMITVGSGSVSAQSASGSDNSDLIVRETRGIGNIDRFFEPKDDFLPQRYKKYLYNKKEEKWVLTDDISYVFDENGNVTEQFISDINSWDGTTEYKHLINKYDEEGRLTEKTVQYSEDGIQYVNLKHYTYKYDDICKDFIIEEQRHEWDAENNEWRAPETNTELIKNVIVRDEKNRLLSKTNIIVKKGVETRNYKVEFNYGKDEHVNFIVFYKNDEDVPTKAYDYIKWYRTDDNMVDFNIADSRFLPSDNKRNFAIEYSVCDYYKELGYYAGCTRVSYKLDDKERIVNEENWTYDKDSGHLKKIKVVNTTFTDENGSCEILSGEASSIDDYDNDNIFYNDKDIYTYNENGNETLYEKWFSFDPDKEFRQSLGNISTYTYDEKGRPTNIVRDYFYVEEGAYKHNVKYEFSDFFEPVGTGIKNVNVNNGVKVMGNTVYFNGAADSEYYVCDMTGRILMSGSVSDKNISLDSLPDGMYIVKTNSENAKVIKK